jgi:uncharacterized protein (TIGR02996 family)
MTTDPDAPFLAAICSTGPSSSEILQYADWLAEHGRDAAASAWRWLHAEGKWPAGVDCPDVFGHFEGYYFWTWFDFYGDRPRLPMDLLRQVAVQLHGDTTGPKILGCGIVFPSLHATLLAFVGAFVRANAPTPTITGSPPARPPRRRG